MDSERGHHEDDEDKDDGEDDEDDEDTDRVEMKTLLVLHNR